MSPSLWSGCRPPQVPTRSSFLTPSWIELLEDDRRAGAPHSGSLHRDRLALERARVAEQAALGVPLDDVVEIGLGDVLGAQRVAGEETRLGVLARFGANVNRHRRETLAGVQWRRAWSSSGGADARSIILAGSGAWRHRRASLEQILRYCAEDPVERVFLEDVARRGLGRFAGVEEDGRLVALCHTGANVVPSGQGCGAFADVTVRARARMLIGGRDRDGGSFRR